MTSGASHCVLFPKELCYLPHLPFILPQWEKSSLSQLVCLLKYKGCLWSSWRSTVTVPRISAAGRHICCCSWMQNGRLSPCDPGKSTERLFDLHGVWTQKHHSRCSHNGQHQHLQYLCAHTAIKSTKDEKNSWILALCPGTQIWTINSCVWQHCKDPT